jgi:ArsR family transcriptional regulator
MKIWSALTKALADEHRLRIMALLHPQELCVCQILELFEIAPSTLSKHLSILKQAGLISARKEGRWVYYRWPEQPAPEVALTLAWLAQTVVRDAVAVADQQRLQPVLALDPIDLCRKQNDNCCL